MAGGGGGVGGVGGVGGAVGGGAAVSAGIGVMASPGAAPAAKATALVPAHGPSAVVKLSAAGHALSMGSATGIASEHAGDVSSSSLGMYGPSGMTRPGHCLGLAHTSVVHMSKEVEELAEAALLLLLMNHRRDDCITALAVSALAHACAVQA